MFCLYNAVRKDCPFYKWEEKYGQSQRLTQVTWETSGKALSLLSVTSVDCSASLFSMYFQTALQYYKQYHVILQLQQWRPSWTLLIISFILLLSVCIVSCLEKKPKQKRPVSWGQHPSTVSSLLRGQSPDCFLQGRGKPKSLASFSVCTHYLITLKPTTACGMGCLGLGYMEKELTAKPLYLGSQLQ